MPWHETEKTGNTPVFSVSRAYGFFLAEEGLSLPISGSSPFFGLWLARLRACPGSGLAG